MVLCVLFRSNFHQTCCWYHGCPRLGTFVLHERTFSSCCDIGRFILSWIWHFSRVQMGDRQLPCGFGIVHSGDFDVIQLFQTTGYDQRHFLYSRWQCVQDYLCHSQLLHMGQAYIKTRTLLFSNVLMLRNRIWTIALAIRLADMSTRWWKDLNQRVFRDPFLASK